MSAETTHLSDRSWAHAVQPRALKRPEGWQPSVAPQPYAFRFEIWSSPRHWISGKITLCASLHVIQPYCMCNLGPIAISLLWMVCNSQLCTHLLLRSNCWQLHGWLDEQAHKGSAIFQWPAKDGLNLKTPKLPRYRAPTSNEHSLFEWEAGLQHFCCDKVKILPNPALRPLMGAVFVPNARAFSRSGDIILSENQLASGIPNLNGIPTLWLWYNSSVHGAFPGFN